MAREVESLKTRVSILEHSLTRQGTLLLQIQGDMRKQHKELVKLISDNRKAPR